MSNEHGRINRLQEVEDLTEYINNGWLHSGESDGPTFLWNDMIREASQEDAENRNNVPVAQLSDADMVISMPMQWYFDSIAAMVQPNAPIPAWRFQESTCQRSILIRRRFPAWTRWSAMPS